MSCFNFAILLVAIAFFKTTHGQSSSDDFELPDPSMDPSDSPNNDYLRATGPIILFVVGGFLFGLLFLIFIMYFICLYLGARRKRIKKERREKYAKVQGGARTVHRGEIEFTEQEFELPAETEALTRTFSAEDPAQNVTTFTSTSTIGSKPAGKVGGGNSLPAIQDDEEEEEDTDDDDESEEEEEEEEDGGQESSEDGESSEEEESADGTLDELQRSMEDLSRSLEDI